MFVPELICWRPVTFTCGHPMEIGVENQDFRVALQRVKSFIAIASAYPCPACGSATGNPYHSTSSVTYLKANDVWYRKVTDPGQIEIANRNADIARSEREDS